jgi:hypothetical protein
MMRKYHRVVFTAGQKAELWERWRKGESLKAIDDSEKNVATFSVGETESQSTAPTTTGLRIVKRSSRIS